MVIFLWHILNLSNEKTNFVKQFIDVGGLNIFTHFNLLSPKLYDPPFLVETCNLLSEIARSSK